MVNKAIMRSVISFVLLFGVGTALCSEGKIEKKVARCALGLWKDAILCDLKYMKESTDFHMKQAYTDLIVHCGTDCSLKKRSREILANMHFLDVSGKKADKDVVKVVCHNITCLTLISREEKDEASGRITLKDLFLE
jgi:hypothetical protein